MAKWEHKGGVRVDAFEKKTDWGAIIGGIIAVFVVLMLIGAIAG